MKEAVLVLMCVCVATSYGVVIEHTGAVNNTTGAAENARFGSKWDFTVTGNTSADPADYTISFDIRNVSGNWDPIVEGLSLVTPNPEVGTDQYTDEIMQQQKLVTSKCVCSCNFSC